MKGDDSNIITVNITQFITKSEQAQDNTTPSIKIHPITTLKEMLSLDKSIISQSFVPLKCSTKFKYYNKREDNPSRDS